MAVPVRKASGLVGLVGASVLAAFPAAGQQVASLDDDRAAYLAAKCAKFEKDPAMHAGCYAQEAINWNRTQSVLAREQAAKSKEQAAAAQQRVEEVGVRSECNEFLKAGRDADQFTRERVIELAGGKVTPDNICDIARKLGYVGPKASAPSHTVR